MTNIVEWAQLKQEQLEAPNAMDFERILAQSDDKYKNI
jgi:hypothetical protein